MVICLLISTISEPQSQEKCSYNFCVWYKDMDLSRCLVTLKESCKGPWSLSLTPTKSASLPETGSKQKTVAYSNIVKMEPIKALELESHPQTRGAGADFCLWGVVTTHAGTASWHRAATSVWHCAQLVSSAGRVSSLPWVMSFSQRFHRDVITIHPPICTVKN